MNEADTCRIYILPKLKSAGWEDEFITEQLVLTPGRIVPIGDRHTRKDGLRPDYVLFIRQNIPIAVVEAKAEYAHNDDIDGFIQEMIKILYRVGLIGVKPESYTSILWSYQGHKLINGEINKNAIVHIHPAFWRILGIHPL